MRRAWALVVLLGCARGPGRPAQLADNNHHEIATLPDAHDLATRAALHAVVSDAGTLYWRLPGPDGPRCEPWQIEPDPDDPARGQLAHRDGSLRFRFAYRLIDDQLQLAAPVRERELPPAPGAVGVASLALPCVFSGMSFAPDNPGEPRRLLLIGRERWFIDPERCAAADPDGARRAVGELRPIGCASALADPATRTQPDDPGPPGPAAARLARSRRLWLLRRRGDRSVCEAWQHAPADPLRGTLSHDERDEPRSRAYGYAISGDSLTLLGPHEFRRQRKPPGELTHAGGCLISRSLRLQPNALVVGDDHWYLRRRACEQALRAGSTPQPDPDCGAAPLAETRSEAN